MTFDNAIYGAAGWAIGAFTPGALRKIKAYFTKETSAAKNAVENGIGGAVGSAISSAESAAQAAEKKL